MEPGGGNFCVFVIQIIIYILTFIKYMLNGKLRILCEKVWILAELHALLDVEPMILNY